MYIDNEVVISVGRVLILSGLLLLSAGVADAQVVLTGRVVNETNAPVAGARVSVAVDDARHYAVTDPTGGFHFAFARPAEYQITVEHEGYFTLNTKTPALADGANEVHLVLNRLREVVESIDVSAPPSNIALDSTASQSTLTGNDILNIPYPTTNNLKNAMRAVPGIVQDNKGDLHLNGGSVEQVQYTLDGFNISDPLTGRLESRLSVEAVQTVEVTSGRMPAEYGKGSSGVIAIRAKPGDDRWRYTATNFVPGVENQGGLFIGNWTPRANLSGPLVRGRAWFSDSFDTQYDRQIVPELPKDQNSTSSWRFSNLMHNQFNLSPTNILYTSFLVNWWIAPRNGLGALDPRETTVNRRARQYFFNIRDQKYFGRGALIEVGAGSNRTFGREIPQGQDLYVYTPTGKRGNYFMDSLRHSSRDQFLANGFLPTFDWLGGHQIKSGIDLDRLTYSQDIRRTGYEFLRTDGSTVRRTEFFGNGVVTRTNFESAAYVQDSWKVRPALLLEIGARTDWDEIIRRWNLSPRLGFAWSPPHLDNTRISGGYSITYDATNLSYFTRPDDQYALTTYYEPTGLIDRGPAVSVFRFSGAGLKSPRYANWTL
ncbi:MAG: carboxypeptidase regulatory-like domain-containing protein [Bryobacteraceae bacterium]